MLPKPLLKDNNVLALPDLRKQVHCRHNIDSIDHLNKDSVSYRNFDGISYLQVWQCYQDKWGLQLILQPVD